MQTVLLVIHLLIALALVGVVLLQRSEGGALGIGGGGGGGGGGFGSMMSARGTANLLTRTTAILAACFMTTSILLAILSGHHADRGSIVDNIEATEPAQQPASEPVEPPKPEAPAVPVAE